MGSLFNGYKRTPITGRAGARAGSRTVLCVDDSAVIRAFIRKALEKGGIEVIEAVNAADANKILHETPVRLVVVDWNMPGMDGGELVRKLRVIPGMADAKIIFATGETSEERLEEIAKIGCDAYIPKPFKPEEILQVVRELLEEKPEEQRR